MALLLALQGCGLPAERAQYQEVVDVAQLMEWILEPAAEVIWDSAGAVITADGEVDLAPVDDAGWDAVRNAAAVVAESGNLLLMPSRARDLDDWMEYSQGMVAVGRRVMAAADARDADALFDVGGQLYNVCVACHQQYWVVDPLRAL